MSVLVKKLQWNKQNIIHNATSLKKLLTTAVKEEDILLAQSLWEDFSSSLNEFSKITSELFTENVDIHEELHAFSMQFHNIKIAAQSKLPKQIPTSSSNSIPVPSVETAQVKVPVIEIPTFSGRYDEWPSVCDSFTTILTNFERLYGNKEKIEERHRHRFEVNPKYIKQLESAGLKFVGVDIEGERMEILELENHPYYVATQFHPEYLSRPMAPSPPFMGLILASKDRLRSYLIRGKLSPREHFDYDDSASTYRLDTQAEINKIDLLDFDKNVSVLEPVIIRRNDECESVRMANLNIKSLESDGSSAYSSSSSTNMNEEMP